MKPPSPNRSIENLFRQGGLGFLDLEAAEAGQGDRQGGCHDVVKEPGPQAPPLQQALSCYQLAKAQRLKYGYEDPA
jgi:hypothetical protein